MHLLRYAWYTCPLSGSYQYLGIFARKRCLALWRLLRPIPGCQEKKPGKGICLQEIEVPTLVDATETGRCKLPGTTIAGSYSQQLQQALSKGRLLLQLIHPVSGVTNTYSLIQVRTGGTAWLFSEVYYRPHSSSLPTLVSVEAA